MNVQTQNLEHIPLNKPLPSPDNVRRRDRKADVDALAAAIEAHGLLQNLAVVDAGEGKFAVVAGSRRSSSCRSQALSLATIPSPAAS